MDSLHNNNSTQVTIQPYIIFKGSKSDFNTKKVYSKKKKNRLIKKLKTLLKVQKI
jgi:hypothetical protein